MTAVVWKKRGAPIGIALRPEARIREQVDGIERMLGLRFRSRILDLGCGAGSQTVELARRKYRVLGMDASPAGLQVAREKARQEGLTAHFVVNDMRRIPYEGEFDAVVNLRNPVGCYARECDDMLCLRAAARALKLGGRILLDLMNREWLIRRLGGAAHEADGCSFDLRASRLNVRGLRPRGGMPSHSIASLRIYSLSEMLRMLGECGLMLRGVYGAYDGRPYGLDTLRMIVVGEKTEAERSVRRRRRDGLPAAIRIKGRPK